jgi:sialidase-1
MKIISQQILEQKGHGLYAEYRIPGIVTTSAGSVLCCYEARGETRNDWARTDLVLRRSTDGGKTFSSRLIVKNETPGITTFGNPVLISDGRLIHFIWHKDYSQAFYQVSRDDGVSFSEPVEITRAFHEFLPRYPWTVIASGPGHGIALQSGRLIVPVWLARGKALDAAGRAKEHQPSATGTLISEDHGATWHGGGLIEGIANGNEASAVELSDHSVLLNIRHQETAGFRLASRSPDGIRSFGIPEYDEALPDPMCFGSLLRGPDGRIYFINCANNRDRRRINLTLRMSQDDCQSWRDSLLIDPVGGYADLAGLGNGTLFCFHERTVGKDGQTAVYQLVLTEIAF